MTDIDKKIQLKKYKSFATGLFLLMLILFVLSTYLQKYHHIGHWIGYLGAFSEAGMVGALADWFAVTALFHHPLGLKIPHTNLIQEKKDMIGDNLGNFVVSNFLAPQNIRPYISKIKISKIAGKWLENNKNQNTLINEISSIIIDIVQSLDNKMLANYISLQAKTLISDLKINTLLGNGLNYFLDKNEHQKLITQLSFQLKKYISEHKEMVSERVKKESHSLIPKFVDEAIASKIINGLITFFSEIETNEQHPMRGEITNKLYIFSEQLSKTEKWEKEIETIKNSFLNNEKISHYSLDIWKSIKKNIVQEMQKSDSSIKNYISKNLTQLSFNLQNDEVLQHKIDHWIQFTAYKYILKNTHQFGKLISSTVGNWEGKELSNKLELEVGKDLQFIRVNGTLVGGLVGLIIYALSQFI